MIFPNRDFITVEGFADHVGQSGKIEVTRPGVGVVGSAIGVVSGGDVAFEVNHPGGICWGEGTGLKVTPDIKAGDVVSLTFGNTQVAATTTLDVAANDAVQTQQDRGGHRAYRRWCRSGEHGTAHHRAGAGRHLDRQARRARRARRSDPCPQGWLRVVPRVRSGQGHVPGDVQLRERVAMRRSRPMLVSASGRWPGNSPIQTATVRV